MMAFLFSLSPLGLGLSAGGLLLGVGILLGLHVLPGFLVRPLVALAGALLLAGAIYQTAYAKATHAAQVRQVEEALRIERAHRATAEAISKADRDRAARAAADLAASEARLKDLSHALETDPEHDRVCVDRDLARRLRAL